MKFMALWLCFACIVIFVVQMLIPGFTEQFMLTSSALAEPWQFLTAVFLHGSITHLLFNLFALFVFGIVLEGLIGSRKLFWLFIISGIIANLVSFYWYPNSLGASGAIMAVIGCLAVLRPKMTVWAFNLPMPMFIAAIIWIGADVLGVFGLGDPGVGHLAHVSGIMAGILYGLYLRKKYPKANVNSFSHSKVILNEGYMRNWEDYYMKK